MIIESRRGILTTKINKLIEDEWLLTNDSQFVKSEDFSNIAKNTPTSLSYLLNVEGYSDPHDNLSKLSIQFLSDLIDSNSSTIRLKMFFSDVVVQPSTKIVNYLGLWKRDYFRNPKFKILGRSDEYQCKVEEGTFFCGICEVEIRDFQEALSFSYANEGCLLFLSDTCLDIDKELLGGYFKAFSQGTIKKNFFVPTLVPFLIQIIELEDFLIFLGKDGEKLSFIGYRNTELGTKLQKSIFIK